MDAEPNATDPITRADIPRHAPPNVGWGYPISQGAIAGAGWVAAAVGSPIPWVISGCGVIVAGLVAWAIHSFGITSYLRGRRSAR